jgi:hypothetical protein
VTARDGFTHLLDRCPWCGRFVPYDADGFYGRLSLTDESYVGCFCSEAHANKYTRRLQERRNAQASTTGTLSTEATR